MPNRKAIDFGNSPPPGVTSATESQRTILREAISAVTGALFGTAAYKQAEEIVPEYIVGTKSIPIVSGVAVIDAADGHTQKLTLTEGLVTLALPINLADGHSIQILGKQDSLGERGLALSDNMVDMNGKVDDVGFLLADQHFSILITRDDTTYLVYTAPQV